MDAEDKIVSARILWLRRWSPRLLSFRIARETGFCHGPHLNNVFKRHEGMTPLAFRELERRRRGS